MAEFPADLHAEIEKYERKHAESPDGRYFLPLANTYRKLGQLERAEELLRAGLHRHPDYLSAHIVLGRTLADRGAAAEATAEFQHVLAVDPQNLIALRTLGELAVGEGRLTDASHWYRELLAVDPMNDEARQALADIEAASAADEVAEAGEQVGAEPGDEQLGAAHADRVATVAASVEDLDAAVEPEQMPEDASVGRDERAVPAWVESIDPFLGDSDAAAADSLPLLEPTQGTGEAQRPGSAWSTDEPSAEADDFELVQPDEAPAADLPELPAFAELPTEADDFELVTAEGAPAADRPVVRPSGEAPTELADAELWDVPLEDEPEDLASETLAELYARQGFTQQAADMYRQLIQRRGAEPTLLLRLAELETEVAGAGEPDQTTAEGAPPPETRDAELEEPLVDLESLETPGPPSTVDTAFVAAGAEPPVAEFEKHPGEPDGLAEADYVEAAVGPETPEPEALEIELAPAEAELQAGIEDAALEELPAEAVAGRPEREPEQDLGPEAEQPVEFEAEAAEEIAPEAEQTLELEPEAAEEMGTGWYGAERAVEPGDTGSGEVEVEVVFEPARAEGPAEVFQEPDQAEAWEEVFPEGDAADVEEAPIAAAAVELPRVEPREEATPFAESFRFGFAGAAETEAIRDAEVSYPAAAMDGSAEAEPAAPLPEQDVETAPAVPTIGEYFSVLLAWAPARRETPDAPAGPSDASAARPAVESGATMLEPSDAGSDVRTGAQVGSAEQELFPWELPGSSESGASSSGREAEEAPPHPADTLSDAGDEASFAAMDDAPAEADAQLEEREEPSPFANPGAEEEDDLESFQAWLRSLKR